MSVWKLEVWRVQSKGCKGKGNFIRIEERVWPEVLVIKTNGGTLVSLDRMLEMKRLQILTSCLLFCLLLFVKSAGIVLSNSEQPQSCCCLRGTASLSLLWGLSEDTGFGGHSVILICYPSAGISVSACRTEKEIFKGGMWANFVGI